MTEPVLAPMQPDPVLEPFDGRAPSAADTRAGSVSSSPTPCPKVNEQPKKTIGGPEGSPGVMRQPSSPIAYRASKTTPRSERRSARTRAPGRGA